MNSVPNIFIMGTQDDPHVNRVTTILRTQYNANVETLDYLNKATFSYSFTEKGSVNLTINKKDIQNNYVIWDREKLIPGTPWYPNCSDKLVSDWNATEWVALFDLISAMHPKKVVNCLSTTRCLLKPYQQYIASSVGFNSPLTLVTNNKQSALTFVRSVNDKAIMKSLSNGLYKTVNEYNEETYSRVMTIQTNSSALEESSDEDLLACPHFFQAEILKSYELRVVIIDDVIFPFKINSQSSDITKLDWRKDIGNLNFELIEISSTLRHKISKFMQKIGLFSGSLDLIVDTNEVEYFLECNQDGAWAWLDDILNGEIAQVFAAKLIKKAKQC